MRSPEYINQTGLPELARFNEARGVIPGEALDLALAKTSHPIFLFTSPKDVLAAQAYQSVLRKGSSYLEIVSVESPIQAAMDMKVPGVIPLVLHSATDPVLNERMFTDGPNFGQLLMGHIYMPTPGHESPSLYTVGVANQGLEIISESGRQSDKTLSDKILMEEMKIKRDRIFGGTDHDGGFRFILRSSDVHKIIAHALGPAGTNIAQAMEQYIKRLGIEGKTDLIVHPKGIEPMAYAEMALKQVENGVVPIHMECAVYYDMANLFNQRTQEVVFADHHYMPLDEMQLASIKDLEELTASGVMRIATHPSPKPLVDPWVKPGRAKWLKATSNSEAAQMVIRGEADACVTTGSGLKEARGLVSRHVFGSPIMLFTIATPLDKKQLWRYYSARSNPVGY